MVNQPAAIGPMVVVSDDRLVALELMVFADLAPRDDIVQLDAASDIAGHLASCDVVPSLFLVAGGVIAETRSVLDQLGLDDVDVIAI